MKTKVLYVERKFTGFYSLEKVFRQIAKNLDPDRFTTAFQQVKFPAGPSGIFKNLFSFKPESADVYHITGDITYMALVLPPRKTVLTIPDLSILRYRTGIRRLVLKKLLFDWPIRRARYITAISQATADAIVQETGVQASKIRTIGLPVDDVFVAAEKPPFDNACPNLLQIGTLRYKNLPNVIKAIKGLKCKFTIIGRLDEAMISMLEESNIDYRNESQLDDDAIREHYRTADIVLFCSVFEGFGLPIIEAQAMNTPVVTSDVDPMRDVAGIGAVLVDPHNVEEIRTAIDKLIEDAELRRQVVADGAENVKRFRPATIARHYAELYREVVEN